ncbi:hypothetical protein AK812_SmicGene27711 [Symbiodinium microadriaticum]|uniref:Translation initiation factor 3 N-terminal domain-containing protein n=1 Tax=Symbiodinium microadriaticum TaxID=2951 RepID=A0A1Q9D6E8_SYMMI|nr:hypothetical protein AK812_SmicGene27711 [Symbiodinium microadriaticum]CAE7523961.1 unnamed protein product [Symbiodinium sp. KB8]
MKANTASIISQSGGIQAGSAREQSAPPLEVERDPYSPARSRPGLLLRLSRCKCLKSRPLLAFAALVAALVGSCSFVVPQHLKVRAPSVACAAAQKKKEYKVNEEIRANEVRVIGIVSDKLETGPARMEEANEIMSLRDALEIARSKGVDVILINEEPAWSFGSSGLSLQGHLPLRLSKGSGSLHRTARRKRTQATVEAAEVIRVPGDEHPGASPEEEEN